ncbi:UDP-N-acetylmuramate--alanine ligase [Ralstonia solanacearum]|nr:UDP-N-acetylmuramate--alanine ligase [Ralstonia solanacearum]
MGLQPAQARGRRAAGSRRRAGAAGCRPARAGNRAGVVVNDLHLWRVGPGRFACVIALASPSP